MGQVPERYGLVGDGRLARHLSHYFGFLKIPHRQWSRKTHPHVSVVNFLKNCDVILLAISDDALVPFLTDSDELNQKTLVHFSGALTLPHVLGFHPLMTFAHELYDFETYKSIVFVGEKGRTPFNEVFEELPNRFYEIPSRSKELYHALCVLGGNFSILLWQKLFEELESRFQIPREAAFPFLNQVTKNLQSHRDPLTGPLKRNDQKTIEANLRALKNDPFRRIYEQFVATYRGRFNEQHP